MDHLTDEQIRACRAGELGPEAAQHVRECDLCRSRLLEERLLDILVGQALADRRTREPLSHPGADQLLQYVEGDLDAYRSNQIETHMLECERCTAQVFAAHRSGYETPSTGPPVRLVKQVREQISAAAPRQSLGQLFFEAIDNVLIRLSFRPSALTTPYQRIGGLPAAASSVGETKVLESPYGQEARATVTAGNICLSFQMDRKNGETRSVAVLVTNTATNTPIADLVLEIITQPTGAQAVQSVPLRTDAEGICRLQIPSQRSRLVIQMEPPCEIELNVSAA